MLGAPLRLPAQASYARCVAGRALARSRNRRVRWNRTTLVTAASGDLALVCSEHRFGFRLSEVEAARLLLLLGGRLLAVFLAAVFLAAGFLAAVFFTAVAFFLGVVFFLGGMPPKPICTAATRTSALSRACTTRAPALHRRPRRAGPHGRARPASTPQRPRAAPLPAPRRCLLGVSRMAATSVGEGALLWDYDQLPTWRQQGVH